MDFVLKEVKLRQDEEYTKNKIYDFLKNRVQGLEVIQGDEPPDYYAIFSGKKIPLEITRSEGSFVDGKEIKSSNDIFEPIMRMCNDLNTRYKYRFQEDITLLIEIKGPLINYNKFKKTLNVFIDKLTSSSMSYSDTWAAYYIEGNKVRVKFIHRTYGKKVVGIIGIARERAIIDIQNHVNLIMKEIFEKKEKKTNNINGQAWNDEKWLGVLNNYILAGQSHFEEAVRLLCEKHTFTKIFLVNHDGEVCELMSGV